LKLEIPYTYGFEVLCQHLLDERQKINLARFKQGLDIEEKIGD